MTATGNDVVSAESKKVSKTVVISQWTVYETFGNYVPYREVKYDAWNFNVHIFSGHTIFLLHRGEAAKLAHAYLQKMIISKQTKIVLSYSFLHNILLAKKAQSFYCLINFNW